MARSTTFDYKVTVVDSGGNKYAIDGNTQQYVTLFAGGTYKFDQADNSNDGHPLRFSQTPNGTHNSGSEYTTGVTTAGTPGSSGAYTQIEVTGDTPAYLFYYCSSHSGMGGDINVTTNSSGRAIFAGGFYPAPSQTNTMNFIHINSLGNAFDYGDLATARASANAAVRARAVAPAT